MQALMLAAGMGRRLGKHTDNQTKCMVKVGGRTLLEHTAEALKLAGISRLIMVVGYKADHLVEFVQNNIKGLEVEFIYNMEYASTNNIYSLYLARQYLTHDDTVLVESDLIFEPGLIRKMLEYPEENVVAVAQYEYWMDGTVTILDEDDRIVDFIEKKDFNFVNAEKYYKTVNIYKLSKEFSCNQYIPFLEAYVRAYGRQQYYESVLKALAHLAHANLKALKVDKEMWYEIDDAQDLDIANTLFSCWNDKLSAYERHFGGYWRFTKLMDFCYLVNPYFPPMKMLDQIKYFFTHLLTQYPSGMNTQKLLAGKMFSLDEERIVVGNGASEIISAIGQIVKGKVAISIPAFNEYIRCFRNCELVSIDSEKDDFSLSMEKLKDAARSCDTLVIINPDNPSGSYLEYDEMIEILECCNTHHTSCIIDESFIDFAQSDKRYTLLDDSILDKFPDIVVIKSISKSYGVPGLRLGIAASYNTKLMQQLKDTLPIWNINSFAEYFMQIFMNYSVEYEAACDKIAEQRSKLQDRLKRISYLRVYSSQANYIMCEVKGKYDSKELATRLVSESNILIKDLSEKIGFSGRQFIRIAVKDVRENNYLIEALKKLE